jgi:all-trans-retinol 13,14-reductase
LSGEAEAWYFAPVGDGYDVIVIGAGLGGLVAAARLARAGRSVLVLEANPHLGGTSDDFRRGPWSFPMGPLSFSYPDRVRAALAEAGVEDEPVFRRNHFQLIAPGLDVVYSQPLAALRDELLGLFPSEASGLGAFFDELFDIIRTIKDIDRWHPAFMAARPAEGSTADELAGRRERVRRWASIPSKALLAPLISAAPLRNLLGSMGTAPPGMSLLNLGIMWQVMSEIGIWFPSWGISGICRRLAESAARAGATIRTSAEVREILVRDGRAAGVRTAAAEVFASEWIISNADYKKTILELLPRDAVPPGHRELVAIVPYTGSELSVYLGVNPSGVDFGAMRAEHLFFRKEIRGGDPGHAEDFEDREIEICRWSDNAPASAPEGSETLVLRTAQTYAAWDAWRAGPRIRRDGYRETKNRLAWSLVRTAESVLPGLAASIRFMEAATPVTYRDWGRRTDGSIAGWSWTDEAARFSDRLLVRTPVRRLLTAGIYAATGLFLGGVPTAMFTGGLAADLVLDGD